MRVFSLFLLLIQPLWADKDSVANIEALCKAGLTANAAKAHLTNEELVPVFVRSQKYANSKRAPEEFWLMSVSHPKDFFQATAGKFEKLAEAATRYEQILEAVSQPPITAETAKKIVSMESDPEFNQILDEYDAMASFEAYAKENLSRKELTAYMKARDDFKSVTEGILGLRKQIKEAVQPGKISHAEAKILLDEWIKSGQRSDYHPDILPDWIAGSDVAVYEDPQFHDPKSGHQIGYGATPISVLKETLAKVPLEKGDTVLDVGSGWGRVVIAGALTHPELKFSGIEYVDYRAKHAQQQIDKMKIQNAKSFQGDASSAAIEKEIADAKALFLFNSFAEPALELFVARTKEVVKKTGEKKYLIAMNEKGFPFKLESRGLKLVERVVSPNGEYHNYTIYEITP